RMASVPEPSKVVASRELKVVSSPADRVTQGSEDPKNEPDQEQNYAERPEDRYTGDESNDEENESENNHETSNVRKMRGDIGESSHPPGSLRGLVTGGRVI